MRGFSSKCCREQGGKPKEYLTYFKDFQRGRLQNLPKRHVKYLMKAGSKGKENRKMAKSKKIFSIPSALKPANISRMLPPREVLSEEENNSARW